MSWIWLPVNQLFLRCTPGVQYVKSGEQNWTPVEGRARGRENTMHNKESTSTSSSPSDSELDVGLNCKAGLLSRAWQGPWSLRSQGLH